MPDDYRPAPGYVAPLLVYDLERGVLILGNYPPGGTPARDPEPAPTSGRFAQRGMYMICLTCGYAVQYCRGHAPTKETPPPVSDLLGRANAKGTP